MTIPRKVKLVEVGPRDGLQNEAVHVPADVKVELIHRLQDAGLAVVEATAFVSPKWVPQMADAAEVMAGDPAQARACPIPCWCRTRRGSTRRSRPAREEVVVFGAATETFSRKNTNCSIAEGLERFAGGLRGGAASAASRCAATSRCASAARTRAR